MAIMLTILELVTVFKLGTVIGLKNLHNVLSFVLYQYLYFAFLRFLLYYWFVCVCVFWHPNDDFQWSDWRQFCKKCQCSQVWARGFWDISKLNMNLWEKSQFFPFQGSLCASFYGWIWLYVLKWPCNPPWCVSVGLNVILLMPGWVSVLKIKPSRIYGILLDERLACDQETNVNLCPSNGSGEMLHIFLLSLVENWMNGEKKTP